MEIGGWERNIKIQNTIGFRLRTPGFPSVENPKSIGQIIHIFSHMYIHDTCAWTPNKINLELKNADRQAIGSWVEVSLGTLGTQAATGNPERQAVGS